LLLSITRSHPKSSKTKCGACRKKQILGSSAALLGDLKKKFKLEVLKLPVPVYNSDEFAGGGAAAISLMPPYYC
jgi:hypothetical protein